MTGFLIGKLLKTLLIFSCCLLVIIVSANEIAARGLIPKTQLHQAKLDQITWQNIQWQFNNLTHKLPKPASQSAQIVQVWQQAGPQLTSLKDRSLVVAEATRKFIQTQLFTAQTSTSAGKNASGSANPSSINPTLPLEQRTIEYAKYLYCKETVKAYENLNPNLRQ